MVTAPLFLVVRGTEFRLHGTCALLAALLAAGGFRERGLPGAAWGLASAAVAILAVLHGELARRALLARTGVATREVWITPLGGVSRLARATVGRSQRVAFAFGSLPAAASLALAAGAVVVAKGGSLAAPIPARGALVAELLWAGIGLGALQLVPLLPFGLARLLLQRRESAGAPERIAQGAVASRLAGVVLVLAGLALLPPLALGGALLYSAASLEQRVCALGAARITGRFGQQY